MRGAKVQRWDYPTRTKGEFPHFCTFARMHFCTEWLLRRHSFLALREPFPYTPVLT